MVNEQNVRYGLHSISCILNHLEMFDHFSARDTFSLPSRVQDELLHYSGQPLCSKTGILRFLVRPGMMVSKGQKIAKVYNAYGRLQETLYAPGQGLVLGHTETSVAYPGASVMSFGLLADGEPPE